jgi:hypothetical protein
LRRTVDAGAVVRLPEVLRMGLTWRDAVSGLAVVMLVIAYAAYLGGARLPLVSSAWAASATILVLGFGCAVCATSDLYTKPQPRGGVAVRRITSGIGMLAVVFGLTGIVADSAYALRSLVMLIIIFWTTAALWHTFSIGAGE